MHQLSWIVSEMRYFPLLSSCSPFVIVPCHLFFKFSKRINEERPFRRHPARDGMKRNYLIRNNRLNKVWTILWNCSVYYCIGCGFRNMYQFLCIWPWQWQREFRTWSGMSSLFRSFGFVWAAVFFVTWIKQFILLAPNAFISIDQHSDYTPAAFFSALRNKM